LYICSRLKTGISLVKPDDMDFVTGLAEIEAES
jgi:hypothetical protein